MCNVISNIFIHSGSFLGLHVGRCYVFLYLNLILYIIFVDKINAMNGIVIVVTSLECFFYLFLVWFYLFFWTMFLVYLLFIKQSHCCIVFFHNFAIIMLLLTTCTIPNISCSEWFENWFIYYQHFIYLNNIMFWGIKILLQFLIGSRSLNLKFYLASIVLIW